MRNIIFPSISELEIPNLITLRLPNFFKKKCIRWKSKFPQRSVTSREDIPNPTSPYPDTSRSPKKSHEVLLLLGKEEVN